MSQHAVAIHVTEHAARMAVWESTLRKAELVGLHEVSLDRSLEPAEMWQSVSAALPSSIASVIASVDSATTSTRLLSFPFSDARKVDAALEFELEGQVPFNLEDMVVASHVVDRTASSTQVLAGLAPKEALKERLEALGAAGLEPRGVVLPATALAELVRVQGDEVVAVLALGDSASHLAVLRRGLKYARTLRAGGGDVDRALAQRLGVDLSEAKRVKEAEARVVGGPGDVLETDSDPVSERAQQLSDAAVEGLAALLSSLAATFKTLPADVVPTRMVVTGGLSRLPGLISLLERRLGVDVELLDLASCADDMPVRGLSVPPEFAVPVAMALTMHRRGSGLPLNFRRGDLAYEGDIQVYRGQVTRVAIGLTSVLLLAIAGSTVRYALISQEEQRIDQAFCDTTDKIVGRAICDPTAALATMRAAPGVSEGVVIPTYSAASLFEMLSLGLAPNVDVSFEELDIRLEHQTGGSDRITGKGEAASFETTEQVVTRLNVDPCVQEATVSNQRKARTSSRVEFSLQVKASCPPGAVPGSLWMGATASAGDSAATSGSRGDGSVGGSPQREGEP